MKSLVFRTCLSFVVLAGTSLGCAAQVPDDPAAEPFEVGVAQSALAIDNVASTRTAASGRTNGLTTSLLRSPTTNDYLKGFTMEERSDDPCKFSALFNDVDTNALSGNELFNECNGGSGNFKNGSMSSSFRTTGLAVCLNSSRDKMKGFALIGRHPECILDPNGTTPTGAACNGRGPRSDAVEERDNCPGAKNGIDSDWESIVECPAGSVVTGVEFNHIASSGGRRMINGAKAICHPLLP